MDKSRLSVIMLFVLGLLVVAFAAGNTLIEWEWWTFLRMIFFDKGEIVEQGTPAQIFSNPQNDRTKLYLSQILHH